MKKNIKTQVRDSKNAPKPDPSKTKAVPIWSQIQELFLNNSLIIIMSLTSMLREYLRYSGKVDTLPQYIPSKLIFREPKLDVFDLVKNTVEEFPDIPFMTIEPRPLAWITQNTNALESVAFSTKVLALLGDSQRASKFYMQLFMHEMRHVYQLFHFGNFPVTTTELTKKSIKDVIAYKATPSEEDAIDFTNNIVRLIYSPSGIENEMYNLLNSFYSSVVTLSFLVDVKWSYFNIEKTSLDIKASKDITSDSNTLESDICVIQEYANRNVELMADIHSVIKSTKVKKEN